ncbi:MAG: TIGR01777 family oxidoreductase [Vicinamibacterales bacterium]
MRVVAAGGSGFLGTRLVDALRADGHDVLVLTRRPGGAGQVAWAQADAAIDGADAVVNLAGESLEAGRWTAERKQRILNSRVAATRVVVDAIARAPRPPGVFLSASAIGIYGPRDDQPVTEATAPAGDFLASVCVAWEREARVAESKARVVLLRTGLVLDAAGGALPRLALPFRFFAGGPLGSGHQWWSWIHVDDWVGMVRWAIDHASVSGPVNLTAPAPVTNREFAKTLGRVLRRPALLPAPAIALRVMLGEMADALILTGQRVLPQRAIDAGYAFRFPTLEPAVRDLF